MIPNVYLTFMRDAEYVSVSMDSHIEIRDYVSVVDWLTFEPMRDGEFPKRVCRILGDGLYGGVYGVQESLTTRAAVFAWRMKFWANAKIYVREGLEAPWVDMNVIPWEEGEAREVETEQLHMTEQEEVLVASHAENLFDADGVIKDSVEWVEAVLVWANVHEAGRAKKKEELERLWGNDVKCGIIISQKKETE